VPTVEGAGVELHVVEHGRGPAVLLVHGLAADGEAMAPAAEALARAGARAIAYDRRGYGSSGAPEPYAGTTVEEQAEDAAAVLRALDAVPAIVAGDGLGALVALDLAKRHGALIAGAALAEPPLFAFVREATEELAAQRAEIEAAVRAGGPEAGVERWLGGRISGPALERARVAYRAFFADFAGLATWPVTRRELRALALPAVVVTGPSSPPHVLAAADALATLLPDARRTHDGDLAAAAAALVLRRRADRA